MNSSEALADESRLLPAVHDGASAADAGVAATSAGSSASAQISIRRVRTRATLPVASPAIAPHKMAFMPGQSFVKFTFIQVDPQWRRRLAEERTRDKKEFAAAVHDFAVDDFIRAYSTVGTKGTADIGLWTASPNLDHIHELHVLLNQSGIMRYGQVTHSFLAMTKNSPYTGEDRTKVRPGDGKYLFVYPFVKTREWYLLPMEERMRVMKEHIEVGREYPQINLNTSYSFGLDDQDFVVSFESDEPADFLDLVQKLRETESSKYTLRDTPMFTCRAMSIEKALNALDGSAPVAEPVQN